MSARPKDFMQRSAWRGFLAIARDWAAIVAVAAVSIQVDSWPFYLAAVWLIGSFQFALSEALLHEASHYNLFPRRAWNDWAEIAVGLPFFRTTDQLREEHKIHHASLGKPSDPLHADYASHGLLEPEVDIAWIWFFKPVLGYAGYYYGGSLSIRPWREGRKIVAFWAGVLAAVVYIGALKLLVLYWLVPFCWCCMSYLYWSEITDHFRAPSGIRSNLSPLKNLLHHNNGYHYVHHHYPSIPWYHLPAAMRALTPGEGDVCFSFIDIYRSLQRVPASPAPD